MSEVTREDLFVRVKGENEKFHERKLAYEEFDAIAQKLGYVQETPSRYGDREPNRADLRFVYFGIVNIGTERVSDEQFDRLAREQGYVRLDERIETLVGMTRLREEWARENPSKALSAALTEECETCFGTGCYLCSMEETGHFEHDDPCPDCGGTGKTLRDDIIERIGDAVDSCFEPSINEQPGGSDWLDQIAKAVVETLLEGADDE